MAKKWPAALRQTCCHRPLRCATSIPPDISLGSMASNPEPRAGLMVMGADPTAAELRASGGVRLARELRGKSYGPIELLAEVPIAPSLRGTRPIPAQVERRRRWHGGGGNDGAQRDTVKDAPIVGLPDPWPHGPHDLGGFRGHSSAPGHRDMGLSGCDGAMSNRDVTGSDRDASMSACDVTGSDVGASVSNHDVAGYRAIFA